MESDDAIFDEQFEVPEEVGEASTHKAFRAPVWVTLIALVIGGFGIAFGLLEILSPGRTGLLEMNMNVPDNAFAAKSWGVRNLALGASMIAAILFRHAGGYIVAFVAAIARETGDLFITLAEEGQGVAAYVLIIFLLGLEIICLLALLAKGVRQRFA